LPGNKGGIYGRAADWHVLDNRGRGGMNIWLRGAIGAGAAIAAAVMTAIAVAVLDLYLTGQGNGSITREVISEPSLGVHMSIGDIAMLVLALVAGVFVWRTLK
jgi:hypothetical protein